MALLLALTAGAVLFLYWLKPPPQRVVGPSTFLWHRVLKERKRRSDFWRWLVSLLVAPRGRARARRRARQTGDRGALGESPPHRGGDRRLAHHGSLDGVGGNTLRSRSRDRARVLLAEGSASSKYLRDRHRGPASGDRVRVAPDSALERLEGSGVSLHESAAFPAADPVLFSDPGDGDFLHHRRRHGEGGASGVRVISVFEPVDNVGVTAFDLRPCPPSRTASRRFSSSPTTPPSPSAWRFASTEPPGKRWSARSRSPRDRSWERLSLSIVSLAGPVRVLIDAPGDGFELDNVAYAYLGSPQKARVVLVSAGNETLETFLGLDPRVSLELAAPGDRACGASAGSLHLQSRRSGDAAFGSRASHPSRGGFVASGPFGCGAREPVLVGNGARAPSDGARRSRRRRGGEGGSGLARRLPGGRGKRRGAARSSSPRRRADPQSSLSRSKIRTFRFQSSFPVLLSNAVSWLSGTEVLASSLATVAVPINERCGDGHRGARTFRLAPPARAPRSRPTRPGSIR